MQQQNFENWQLIKVFLKLVQHLKEFVPHLLWGIFFI